MDAGPAPESDQDPGNPTVTFRRERRSHQTHVSITDPDAKLANKSNGTAAMGGGDTVNGLMENRHRLLLGITVETFRGQLPRWTGGAPYLIRSRRHTLCGFRQWGRRKAILPNRF